MTEGIKFSINEDGSIELGDNNKRKREFKGHSLVDFPDSYVIVDIETTGLDPRYNSIIEVGAVKYVYGEEKETFSQLIKPDSYYILDEEDIQESEDYCIVGGEAIQYVDSYITQLTGITNKMLERAKCEADVIKLFKAFLGESIIIGHNVNFDINFIYDSYMEHFNEPLTNDFVDTMRIARKVLKELNHHRLRDLAANYDGAHRSLNDCYIANEVFKGLQQDILNKYESIGQFKDEFKHRNMVQV